MSANTQTRRYLLPKLNLLVEHCAALQAAAGEATFFLAQRRIRELLGEQERLGDRRSLEQATRYIHKLVFDGVLQLVSKGTGRKANEYRYLGGQR